MKLWLAKVSRGDRIGLVPTDDLSQSVIARLGDGECAQFSIVRPRSLPWHRMYFGICREIGRNQDPQRDESSIDMELRVRAGHYEPMFLFDAQHPNGYEVRIPKRIAFDKLTHDEWVELWPSFELAIREHFGDEYIRELAA